MIKIIIHTKLSLLWHIYSIEIVNTLPYFASNQWVPYLRQRRTYTLVLNNIFLPSKKYIISM